MIALFAAGLAAQAVAAAPPAAAADADARCIVVLGFVGSRGAPGQAEAATRGILYFVGKLRGRDPAADIASIVGRAAGAARAAGLNARAEGERCSAEIATAGAALSAIRPTSRPNRPVP